jgi:DNA-binding NtrC family response regulator
MLVGHSWPGNIRELRNVMERALTLCRGDQLTPANVLLDPELPDGVEEPAPAERPTITQPAPAAQAAQVGEKGRLMRMDAATERALILQALEQAGGNQSKASEILGISRRTLINRLDEYGLKRPRKRVDEE